MLQHGEGVARDLPAAIQYYEQAARMGSVAAAVNIGDCWRELAAILSIVKAEDCAKKALAAYAKAAGMEGNPEAGAAARDSLRALYDLPRYQENQAPAVFRKVVSCEQALKWMRKAAEGDPKAAEALPGLEAYIKRRRTAPAGAGRHGRAKRRLPRRAGRAPEWRCRQSPRLPGKSGRRRLRRGHGRAGAPLSGRARRAGRRQGHPLL